MPVLYSVIARGTVVLTKYASCAGNFTEVTEQIMTKIPPDNGKLTYSHGSYLFHYICENRIIYMCVTDDVSIIILLVLLNSLFSLHYRKLGGMIAYMPYICEIPSSYLCSQTGCTLLRFFVALLIPPSKSSGTESFSKNQIA